MAIRVGRWDCPSCGQIGNPGPETSCSGCGKPRGSEVRFYLPEDAPEVIDKQKLKEAKAGADWNCDYCGSANSAQKQSCSSCGNAKDRADISNAEKVYQMEEVPRSGKQRSSSLATAKGQADTSNVEKYQMNEVFQDGKPPTPPATKVKIPKKAKWKKKLLIGVISFIAFVSWWGQKIYELPINGFEWERTVAVFHNDQIIREGWQVPSGTQTIKSFRAIHHYDYVFDHYETKTRWVKVKVGKECQVTLEDWEAPSGAKIIKSFRAIHHYDYVFDHYETKTRWVKVKVGEEKYVRGKRDLGNGYFEDVYATKPVYGRKQEQYQEKVERRVPVYQTKYVYSIKKWIAENYENKQEQYQEKVERQIPVYQTKYVYSIDQWKRDRITRVGGQDHQPYWPQGAPQDANWRAGAKTEKYYLVVTDQYGDKHKIAIDLAKWRKLRIGQIVRIKYLYSDEELVETPKKH